MIDTYVSYQHLSYCSCSDLMCKSIFMYLIIKFLMGTLQVVFLNVKLNIRTVNYEFFSLIKGTNKCIPVNHVIQHFNNKLCDD